MLWSVLIWICIMNLIVDEASASHSDLGHTTRVSPRAAPTRRICGHCGFPESWQQHTIGAMRHLSHQPLRTLFALLFMVAASQAMARDYSGHYGSRHGSGHGYAHVGGHHSYYGYPARGYATYHLPHGYYSARY